MLVDHKNRDLRGCALIAKHLRDRGVECALEPINAWQAVLGAYQPDFILFNHVLREHLADYTARLGKMGVLTGVLPNEGLLYNDQIRAYNSGREFANLHLDYYFCWNQPHKDCLLANGYAGKTDVHVVGVPRFDYYFEPWSRIFPRPVRAAGHRPQILVCTNFGFAEWRHRPREVVDRFFAQWKDRISHYHDYWNAIEVNYRSRLRFLSFLEAILAADKFDVVLKTHPREDRTVYEEWLATMPPSSRAHLTYVPSDANITPLILNCDLEISCEKCTTAMESWVASKPTIELVFEKHPVFYDEAFSALNPLCDDPSRIVASVDEQLAAPAQTQFREGRQRHLAKWCGAPAGQAARAVADIIADALHRPSRKNVRLDFHDYRRAVKLKAYRAVNKPYTFFPLTQLRQRLFGLGSGGFSKKLMIYEKSVTPRLVRETLEQLDRVQAGAGAAR